jgi:hypothetical protein
MFSKYADKVGEILWQTKDGRSIKVKEMDYFHLRNALKYVNKRYEEYSMYYIKHSDFLAKSIIKDKCLYLNALSMILQKEIWNREEHKSTDKLLQYWASKTTDLIVKGD